MRCPTKAQICGPRLRPKLIQRWDSNLISLQGQSSASMGRTPEVKVIFGSRAKACTPAAGPGPR
jgi:hypothetical protein